MINILYTKYYILLGIIICFLERKDKDMKFKNLSIFYVNMIMEGKCLFENVPKLLKPYVKQTAIDLGVWEIIENGPAENSEERDN